MKTAVEWLIDELQICATKQEMDIIEQANKLFEEQVIEARDTAPYSMFERVGEAEEYYDKTFKSE